MVKFLLSPNASKPLVHVELRVAGYVDSQNHKENNILQLTHSHVDRFNIVVDWKLLESNENWIPDTHGYHQNHGTPKLGLEFGP